MRRIVSALKVVLLVLVTLSPVIFYWLPIRNAFALDSSSIDVWWPTNNAVVSGVQPFKALLKNNSIENYYMFWSVDDGQWNWMSNNYQDYPHKESIVDLSGWNWKGAGPYKISFIVQNTNGLVIDKKDVLVTLQSNNTQPQPTVLPTVQPTIIPTNTPVTTVMPTITPINPGAGNGSLTGYKFFVNPNSTAKQTADQWRASRPADAALMDKVALGAESYWIGNWNANVTSDVANFVRQNSADGSTPVFIAYNIPQRDCGGYSSGGTNSPDGYRQWINNFASGIGSSRAIVVLEPDSTSLTDCLSFGDKATRFDLLKYAVQKFKSLGNTKVYIDAGHPLWIDANEMANRLRASGIDQADGFSLNVSSFYTTQENFDYGTQLSNNLGGKHFIIDTSRNGKGASSDYQWCNPSGRGLGTLPTTNTGNGLVDAFLWLKKPGESDGNCNGGPSAGVWWPEYALGLARNASW